MEPHSEETRAEAKTPVAQVLRQLVARCGPAVIDDLRCYLRMCLKAEELRQYGLRACVRGHWRRWLVVIERSPEAEVPVNKRARSSRAFMRRGQIHTTRTQPAPPYPQRITGRIAHRSSLISRRVLPLSWFE